jgi:serine/threonine protein kinase
MTKTSPLESIFFAALEKQSAAERSDYLDEACAGDNELRGRVERMLAAQAEAGSFLEAPISPPRYAEEGLGEGLSDVTKDQPPITEKPGAQIGPYKLLQQIGEGGMGVVFMAEQTEPIQRTVALKIIKPGMDTRQVIARFEAERQAVAMMDHPNIAKVLDAGTTDSGRPYFVMELVKGVPITKYCDDKHLPLRARLELFVQVCQAVQHAHQKGIIHRDIKPNNVLVAEYDNQAVPKVIDFGVAKATAQRLTERTMFTEFGQVLGTMEYMSPEQSKFNQLDVDTRSDIYSLGVLLYELLAGSTPFEGKRLKEAAFDEMLRIIREEEPPKPSTRLSSLSLAERASSLPLPPGEGQGEGAFTLASIAANRHTEPTRLSKDVRGELDWIVMKALEKDRNRRYETASSFAADIERHLHDEPVEAGPPSAAYRFRKFTKRNKAALIAASVVTAALFLGLIGTTWQAIRATHAERLTQVQRDRALEAEKLAKGESERANQEAARAKNEAAIAQAVNDFLNHDLLEQADPTNIPYDRYTEPRADLKLLTVLDRAAEKLEGRFDDQPLVEAALRHTIGYTYGGLGGLDNDNRAALHLQRAVELREAHLGEAHPDTLSSLNELALAKSDPELIAQVLEGRRRVLGSDHPDTLNSMFGLAMVTRDKGEPARAIELLRETITWRRKVLGEDHPQTAYTMHCLAHTLFFSAGKDGIPAADYREIESMYRHALEVFSKERGDTWHTYDITFRLGEFLNSRHCYEESEALFQDALTRLQSLSGADPEWAVEMTRELDAVYRNWGKPERAAEWERKRAAATTQPP